MSGFLLLADETPLSAAERAQAERDGLVVVHWNAWRAAAGEVSLPERLRAWLLRIRAEHMAWAYDMGRCPVRMPGLGARELQACLRQGGSPSMWWCSLLYERHPKMTPDLYAIYRLRCLELLMDERDCQSLRLRGGSARLRATLAKLCAASGRVFAVLPAQESGKARAATDGQGRPGLLRRLYAATPAPLRALARYAHWWWTVRRHLPFAGRNAPGATACGSADYGPPAVIATYFPNVDLRAAAGGRFRSRYWEGLHDALNAEARRECPQGGHFVRWLFIRFPSPDLSLRDCLRLRDSFRASERDGLSYHYLEEFLSPGDVCAAWLRWLRLAWASLSIQAQAARACHFAGSRLNFWAYVQADWAESFRGWRCLERCLQNRAFRRHARMTGPRRWTLFPLENCPWERMLTEAARAVEAGPVFGAQHSSVRPTDFRYFDDPRTFGTPDCAVFQPDAVEGNGDSACRQWLEAGMPPERLGRVEALRYLYLAEAQRERQEPAGHQTGAAAGGPASHFPQAQPLPPEPGEPLAAPPGRTLLVLTSFFRDETEAHLRLLADCWRQGLLASWAVVVKPHPYLPVCGLLEELLGEESRRIHISDAPLAQALAQGITVWTSNSTTAALEAAMKGLPLMVMLPHEDFDLCPIQDVPGLARTATPDDVARLLPALAPLTLPPGYLDLDAAMPRWRGLLGLNGKNDEQGARSAAADTPAAL